VRPAWPGAKCSVQAEVSPERNDTNDDAGQEADQEGNGNAGFEGTPDQYGGHGDQAQPSYLVASGWLVHGGAERIGPVAPERLEDLLQPAKVGVRG
jgi:hypothetical protein